MEVGFGLITCQRYPGDGRSDADLYREALELAQEAERLGLDSVWLSEHHFVDDAYMPSLLPVAAAIAARTERVRIGTGLLLAPLYEPVRLAEDAATVDLLSGGRLVLGLGQGWRKEEFEALRVPLRGRHRRLEDTVATLRQAWAGQLVIGGETVSYPDVAVMPLPEDGGPPIWIGALAEPAARRAGRLADGFMATEVTPESFRVQVGWVREELERAGRDSAGFAFALHLPTFAWDGDDAWERVAPYHHYVEWKYGDMAEARGRRPPPAEPPPPSADEEAALRASILLGRPEEVAEQIRAFDEGAGGGVEFVARLYWPGMDPVVQREALAVFAERVVPLLRD
ncbi:MAG: LLM class flavin-dependent oxidoreductase [Actinomycetota bacterium]|nr:LLM class flavin-dependent oxidoreductase [Actinomycetota bacterium]